MRRRFEYGVARRSGWVSDTQVSSNSISLPIIGGLQHTPTAFLHAVSLLSATVLMPARTSSIHSRTWRILLGGLVLTNTRCTLRAMDHRHDLLSQRENYGRTCCINDTCFNPYRHHSQSHHLVPWAPAPHEIVCSRRYSLE